MEIPKPFLPSSSPLKLACNFSLALTNLPNTPHSAPGSEITCEGTRRYFFSQDLWDSDSNLGGSFGGGAIPIALKYASVARNSHRIYFHLFSPAAAYPLFLQFIFSPSFPSKV